MVCGEDIKSFIEAEIKLIKKHASINFCVYKGHGKKVHRMTHSTTALRCSAFTSRVLHMFVRMFVLITFSSNKYCMPVEICQRCWRGM